jgi:uncharacterized membrane protein
VEVVEDLEAVVALVRQEGMDLIPIQLILLQKEVMVILRILLGSLLLTLAVAAAGKIFPEIVRLMLPQVVTVVAVEQVLIHLAQKMELTELKI